jgi:hypothetical protein
MITSALIKSSLPIHHPSPLAITSLSLVITFLHSVQFLIFLKKTFTYEREYVALVFCALLLILTNSNLIGSSARTLSMGALMSNSIHPLPMQSMRQELSVLTSLLLSLLNCEPRKMWLPCHRVGYAD